MDYETSEQLVLELAALIPPKFYFEQEEPAGPRSRKGEKSAPQLPATRLDLSAPSTVPEILAARLKNAVGKAKKPRARSASTKTDGAAAKTSATGGVAEDSERVAKKPRIAEATKAQESGASRVAKKDKKKDKHNAAVNKKTAESTSSIKADAALMLGSDSVDAGRVGNADSTNGIEGAAVPAAPAELAASLRQRLQDKIAALREQRSADKGPTKTRAELLAEREEAKRKRREKLKKLKKKDEATAASAAPTTPATEQQPAADATQDALQFGLVRFEGEKRKRKRIADPKQALEALQKKKKGDAETEAWQQAMTLARGRDPQSDARVLQKAAKKRDKTKEKSRLQWKERERTVRRDSAKRQKTRERNLQERIDAKKKPRKKRPGFEGSGHRVGAKKK